MMFSHSFYYHKAHGIQPRSTLLNYFNQRTLALVMFVALALLGSNPWQSMAAKMSSLKKAFNDPVLVEYANEQGFEMPDSPTSPLLNCSSRQAMRRESLPAQSGEAFPSR